MDKTKNIATETIDNATNLLLNKNKCDFSYIDRTESTIRFIFGR